MDMVSADELKKVREIVHPDVCVSAQNSENIEELKELIFNGLEFMRVFCKDPGKPPDMDVPVIIKRGSTIEDFATKLHREFKSKFKFARVWGVSAKFPGQKQALKHILKDKDIVELHIR